ncbi:class I SAM-dependent methyltransferase [Sulfurospirillum oryzae]|uniref:class I SAM-dependent methyltransferase n=1 Tax=Sulfurospirillum oryzae TaxID=2976535 RepID=UPI0021E79870|nr:class I SAM-dependent methyltransferase [Sulfurospirillum oryzae]
MINSNDLPEELWLHNEQAVKLCTELETKYIEHLHKCNAYELAKTSDGKSHPIGGSGATEAIEHFAYRFVNSSTRVIHITLDPDKKFSNIQIDIFSTFSKGNISILDLACGTGGHILSLLTTLVELRLKKLLPTLPLNIHILAADISPKALEIYQSLLHDLEPYLLNAGIRVIYSTYEWDACSSIQTSSLMDTFFEITSTISSNEYYVITSAFSGFAGNETNFTRIERSLQHITDRLGTKNSTFLWIEPDGKDAKKFLGLLNRIFENIKDFFVQIFEERESISHTYCWWEPIKKEVIKKGNVSIKLYKRNNE